jgi:hypothetical protein
MKIAEQERERLLVRMPAHPRDERRMRHAHAEEEAIRVRLGQRLLRRRHRHRVATPDVRDAGRDDEPLRPREQHGRMRERLAPERFGNPQRLEPELLDLPRRRLRLRRRKNIQEVPDPDASDVHRHLVPRSRG